MSEKPIRHSEKRIRHATGRDDINRRGGVSRRHLSKRSVDYDQLMPNLRDDVAHAVTEAAVVASQKAVWDRARAITEQGTFLAEKIEGAIHRAQLAMDVQQELDDAAQRLSESEAELSDARARLEQAVQDLAAVGGRVTTVEQSIAILEDELESKISKTEFDSLQGRVQAAETAISQNAEEIALRAYASDVDTLTARISDAEATLALHANQIEARVRQSDFDVLQGRVQTAETQISQHSDLIALKASQEELDTLAGRVSSAESEISVLAGEIELRATKSDVDALANRVSTAEATLQVHADEITSRVMKSDFDALVGRVSAAESAITQTEEYIESEVTRIEGALNSPNPNAWYSSIKQTADAIEDVVGRLDSTNDELWFASIKQTAEEIESVVAVLNRAADHPEQFSSIRQTAAEIESVVAMLNSDPDAAGQYSSIRQTHEQITSIVAMLESDPDDPRQYSAIRQLVDEIDLRVKADEIITAINLSKEGVRIRGNRVEIDSDTIIAKGAIHAEALNIGRIPSSLPEGGHLFRFDKSLASTRGLRPLPGHVATLRPGEGRFGGAVAVEEGTTNLITGDTALAGGPTLGSWIGYGYDIALDDTEKFMGHPTMRVELDSSQSQAAYVEMHGDAVFPVQPGQTYTLSLYVNIPAPLPQGLKIYLGWYRQDGSYISGSMDTDIGPSPLGPTNGWVRISGTATSPADAYWARVRVGTRSRAFYHRFWMCRVQVEAKPFPTSFVDGTRAAGVLRYSASGIINPDAGTIAFWYRPEFDLSLIQNQSTSPKLIQVGNYYNNGSFTLWHHSNPGRLGLYVRGQDATGWTASGSVSPSNTGFARSKWSYVAVTWDGLNWAVYVDGRRVLSITSSQPLGRIAGDIWQFAHGSTKYSQLFDELLILPYAASEDEIRTWYELDAPFYDAAEVQSYDMPDGHEITLDRTGMTMTPAGFDKPGMRMTGYMMGFWDKDGVPAIGLGDLRQMTADIRQTAPELAPPRDPDQDPKYGLLLVEGEVWASRSVLQAALDDYAAHRSVISPGAVDRQKLSPETVGEQQIQKHGIGITRLGEQIQVPLISSQHLNVLREEGNYTVSRESWTAGTWYTIQSFTFPKKDTSKGLSTEAMRLVLHVAASESTADRHAVRLRVNGSTVSEWGYGSFGDNDDMVLAVVVDARALSDPITVEWQWRRSVTYSSRTLRWQSNYRRIYQNDQLPLRWGTPQYSMDGTIPTGCFGGCQVSCQSGCEATCQGTCEVSCQGACQQSCQSACESSCQSTCETTSQGGGGCLREGTPVTIWDADEQMYREIPVEELKPGMILPGYNPETDTLEHGELIELQDARFSNRFLRIHTDNGPSVDVTYTQPFDVLADMGDGWRWYKLAAKFLRPGMKLVRPFEVEDKRLSTITEVEHVREHMVHFWLPKTSHGYVTVAGYGDAYIIKN